MKWILLFLVTVPVNSLINIAANIPDNITSNPCTDQNHLFLAPGVLTAGGTNRACVSRFHPEGPARMTITLLTNDQQAVTANRELPTGDGGCVDISVPQLPNTKAELIISLRYPESKCTWERRMSLRIASSRLVVVHTERAWYRPGETLRIRVFVLKADLAPAHGPINEIWLEETRGAWEGARAAQWLHVRTRLGIAQIQHEIDDQAPPGRWTVRAKMADGSQGSSSFWIGDYELPPFQLSVRHAPRVLRTSERLVWTVCVRYPWTEAVEGMLVIRLRGAGGNSITTDGNGGIRTAVRLRAPRACHRHAAAARRIGLDGANPPDVVVADFSFQEEGTRIWQNTTVVSQVVNKPITLEFLTKHRAVIAPGLPYKLKVKATRWDDKPATNELVHVCRSPAAHTNDVTTVRSQVCSDAFTDSKGVARVMFTADEGSSVFHRFQASLQNDTDTTAPPLFLPVQRAGTAHAALGPLRGDAHATRTFVPLYLNLSNITTAITVHFVVITRGGIIYRWGATTQCPIANSANQIRTAPRNSECNNAIIALNARTYGLYAQNYANVSDALLERHLLRVMLPIKMTHQMCPDSHLVAYFYYRGELISASKHFELEECFVNKVEATWLSRQASPGSSATLQLSIPGPALCALTALNAASKWVQPAHTVKDTIMGGLRRLIEDHRNLTEYDAAGECFLNTDTPGIPTKSIELTAAWLAAAGVRILGGDVVFKRRCEIRAPSPLTSDEEIAPRSDFSEAWLWRLVAIGANGTGSAIARTPDSITRYEATALCVARNGVAISSPAVLQVFREFFIHADSPRRLRRGDTTIIRYRLFNYLYEQLSVQIQVLTDSHLETSDYVESACIGGRASLARRVGVHARLAGNARLRLYAKAVPNAKCANATGRTGVSDEVAIQIEVDPEGVPVREHQSTLLCGKDSSELGNSRVSWTWSTVQAVPGTQSVTVWAVGDIKGPLLADADALVLLPRGCGEQNMARLATNLLALQQLDPQAPAAVIAKEHVARGFTRQLQYIHPSGGFSAFGSSDGTPSTWLTAFAVRYLRKAHQVISPGLPAPVALDRAERWLLGQQMENGCFRNEGQVFHRELKGGLNEDGETASVALTAYVISSLVESSIILPSRVLRNTLSCLRALPPVKTKTPTRIYAHTVLAYTFMRLRKYEEELRKSNEASLLWERKEMVGAGLKEDEEMRELVEMLRMARRSGDFVWWETGSLSTSIEATGYALLALSNCPPALRDTSCAHDARAAVRWLSTHRNAAGGFESTQDTLVALEALISWSSTQPSTYTNLNVTARSGGSVQSVMLQPGDKVPELMKMTVGNQISIAVEGTGCALVQATRSYNTLSSSDDRDKLLSVQVSVHTDGAFDCDTNGTNCFCAAVVEACVIWSGAFPEMALLEISLPGGFGADVSLLYSQLQQANTLLRRIELSPNSGKATLYLATKDGSDTMGRAGHQCYNLHAVGPKTKTKPAYAKVMDYYKPVVNDTQMYTIPEECLAKISHEANRYIPSVNLYKAKSLDEEDDVTPDVYPFDDIPDGIPLEDPLYDNLTNKEIGNLERETRRDVEAKANVEEYERRAVKMKIETKADFDNVIIETESNHRIEVRDESKQEANYKNEVDNPNLTGFHVINTDKDLDVPPGVEGPVPAVVLPPQNFVVNDPQGTRALPNEQPRSYQEYPSYTYLRN